MSEKEPRDPIHSISEIELPVDPADLFVVLYDVLPDRHFGGPEAITWWWDPDVQQRAEQVCEDVLSDGLADTEMVRDIIGEHGAEGMFTVLIGLDLSFEVAGLYSGSAMRAMAKIGRRYFETNSLNTNTEETGLLLPRYTRPVKVLAERPGPNKPDFFSVHRVTPADRKGILHGGILNRTDPVFSTEKAISIGSAPILEAYADLEFELVQNGRAGLYRITPNGDRLRPRIDAVIKNLEESGAEIGVLPESTLSHELRDHWDTLLDIDPPDISSLQWVLLGTGPLTDSDPPPNRAVLVDRVTGDVLLEQDKMAGFTLGRGQASKWRLPDPFTDEPAAEYITRGQHVAVLETALGRVAILICEDVKQSAFWLGKCQAFGVSHIFVPLFATPINGTEKKWERVAAEHCVEELGAWVVLSNSLAVGTALQDDDTVGLDDDCFNCLVIGPPLTQPDEYALLPARYCRSDSGAELARVICDEYHAPPAVEQDAPPPLPTVRCGGPTDVRRPPRSKRPPAPRSPA